MSRRRQARYHSMKTLFCTVLDRTKRPVPGWHKNFKSWESRECGRCKVDSQDGKSWIILWLRRPKWHGILLPSNPRLDFAVARGSRPQRCRCGTNAPRLCELRSFDLSEKPS